MVARRDKLSRPHGGEEDLMGLPNGFHPRACPFCGSRHLHNHRLKEGVDEFVVECIFCGGKGPVEASNDNAWLVWNGLGRQAPLMFGSPQEVIG